VTNAGRRALLRVLGLGAGALALGPVRARAEPLAAATPRLLDGRVELAAIDPRGVGTTGGGSAAGPGVIRAGAGGARGACARGLVDAPFAATMRALVGFDRYARTFAPLVTRARVLSRAHGRARLYLELALPEPLGAAWCDLDVRVDGAPSGEHALAFTRRDGSLAALDLRVELAPTPGRVRTVVALSVYADPGVAVLGPSLVSASNRDAARAAFGALRRGVAPAAAAR
jgi:hypothetical protein